MAKCFLHIKKIKDMGAMTASYNHNFRISDVGNADPSKSGDNRVLVELRDGEDYVGAYKRKIQESDYYVDHKVYKNAIKGMEIMLTYNGSEVDPEFDREAWERENVKFLQNTFGADNVVSVVVHYDETTPHIHAMVVPMIDGHLRGKTYLDGRDSLRKIQDEYARAMEPLGLERGRRGSKARHEDIKEFYGALNSTMEKELPPVLEGETAEEYRRRAQAVYTKENLRHLGVEKKYQHENAALEGESEYNARFEDEYKRRLSEVEKREDEIRKQEDAAKVDRKLATERQAIDYALEHGAIPNPEVSERFGGQVKKLIGMGIDMMREDGILEEDLRKMNEI